jgi:hypothetical protein
MLLAAALCPCGCSSTVHCALCLIVFGFCFVSRLFAYNCRYHRVTQTETTIAVNYWHDMHFGDRWVYQSVIDRLCGLTVDLDDRGGESNDEEDAGCSNADA